MLRDSPCGDTSKAATVAVLTHDVSLRYKWKQKKIFFQISSETTRVVTATVAVFDVSPQGLSRNIKYRSTFSASMSQSYWWMVHFVLTDKFVYMGQGDRYWFRTVAINVCLYFYVAVICVQCISVSL
jgi:hypothetical protein